MKIKVSKWGNSHGVRFNQVIMDHLRIGVEDDVDVNLTSRGLEIVKKECEIERFRDLSKEIVEALKKKSNPVRRVDNPDAKSDVAYIVIDVNPCAPLIREVPLDTKGSFATLAEAKMVARQILQDAISEAKASLSDLRQVGIAPIEYISL